MNSAAQQPSTHRLLKLNEAIANALAEAASNMHRSHGFGATAEAIQPSMQRLEALRARRHDLLAGVALSTVEIGELDKHEAAIAAAEQQALAAGRAAEIARAGRDKLLANHAAAMARATALSAGLPAARYAAGLELVAAKLESYRQSLEAMGAAHAALSGACAAVDEFASYTDSPARPSVTGELYRATFAAPLPSMPGLDPKDWMFDVSQQVTASKAATLAALGVA